MTTLLDAIRQGWSWTGVDFAEVRVVSPMGQVLVSDASGIFHHLDPEERRLIPIGSEAAVPAYFTDPDVALIWRAEALVAAARDRLGELREGYVYTLTPHALIAGNYAHENLCMLPAAELMIFSGELERQVKDLPEGSPIQLKVVN